MGRPAVGPRGCNSYLKLHGCFVEQCRDQGLFLNPHFGYLWYSSPLLCYWSTTNTMQVPGAKNVEDHCSREQDD